ncbi:MAG: hypothetical protein WDN23_11335 [Edaphobacter sp.]
MNRRSFLTTTAAAAATLPFLRSLAQGQALETATLKLHLEEHGPTVPRNFVGLSYETQQLSDPAFFSPANKGLIAKFRALTPHGVLRIGGNTSDVGWWKPTPTRAMPPLPGNVVLRTPPGERSPLDLAYAITPEAVRNLRAFLDATGWTCLYGINLGTNTPALAAEQAAFVDRTLGSTLEYFQIGNEPDNFHSHFRDKATWNAEAYLDQWLAAATAIRARVPAACFGLPDVAYNTEWLAPIADRLKSMHDAPNVAAITHHYYFTGPPSNPKANPDALLHPDPHVQRDAELARAAASKLDTAWRMTEGNTCYRGGKPGLSDVFAASLWAADYMLTLASLGYSGVNLHGGDGQMVAKSLGGRLPGDDMVHDDPASHPHPYYTPIAHIGSEYVAEPVYYGMLFAQRFVGTQIIPIDFDPGPVNATAYAARRLGDESAAGNVLVGVINKDATKPLSLRLPVAASSIENIDATSLTARDVRVGRIGLSPGADRTVPPHSMAIFTLTLKTSTAG